MALCFQPQHSDFRGYPASGKKDYWKTIASNPCSVNPDTFTHEPLYFNEADGKYYVASTMALANGKYFDNPYGQGKYLNIVDGVPDDTIESINYVCNRLPDNEAPRSYFEDELNGVRTSVDVYNNYILIAYGNLNIVVRYPKSAMTTNTAVGKIVAGEIGTTDVGKTVNAYLNLPLLIKANPANGNFVVYSGGYFKSFKVFDINGNFLYRHMDSDNPDSTTSNLNYKPSAPQYVVSIPANWTGIVGKLTYRDFGSSSSQLDQTIDNLWYLEAMDFVTIPGTNTETVFILLYSHVNSTGANNFAIYALYHYPAGELFGTPTIVQNLATGTSGVTEDKDELIPTMCVSKMYSTGVDQARVELTFIHPLGTGDKNYQQVEYRLEHYLEAGIIPWMNPATSTVVTIGNFNYDVGNQKFDFSIKTDIKKDSSNKLIVAVCSYKFKRWDYQREQLEFWAANASVAGVLVAMGFILQNLPGTSVSWKIFGITPTTQGLIGVAIAAVIQVAAFLLIPKPTKRVHYTVFTITPSSGGGATTYTRNSGHWESYWAPAGFRINYYPPASQLLAAQTGSVTASEFMALSNSSGYVGQNLVNRIKLSWGTPTQLWEDCVTF